jgi:uncharacterized protein (TIGR02246 family)
MGVSIALVTLAALGSPTVPPAAPQGLQHAVVTIDHRAPAVPHDLAALRDEYVAAVNTADAAGLARLYAPDARVVVADGIVLRGGAEIGRYFQEAFAAGAQGARVTLRPERFSVDHAMASETGEFFESRDGDSAPSATGVYVTIYTRDATGNWRIAMEVRTRGRDKQLVRW